MSDTVEKEFAASRSRWPFDRVIKMHKVVGPKSKVPRQRVESSDIVARGHRYGTHDLLPAILSLSGLVTLPGGLSLYKRAAGELLDMRWTRCSAVS